MGGRGDEFSKKKMYAHSSEDKEGEDKCFCIFMSQHEKVSAPSCFSSKWSLGYIWVLPYSESLNLKKNNKDQLFIIYLFGCARS